MVLLFSMYIPHHHPFIRQPSLLLSFIQRRPLLCCSVLYWMCLYCGILELRVDPTKGLLWFECKSIKKLQVNAIPYFAFNFSLSFPAQHASSALLFSFKPHLFSFIFFLHVTYNYNFSLWSVFFLCLCAILHLSISPCILLSCLAAACEPLPSTRLTVYIMYRWAAAQTLCHWLALRFSLNTLETPNYTTVWLQVKDFNV